MSGDETMDGGNRDKAGGKARGPAPTILQAKTGLALLNGAPSTAAAMRKAGYAEASTHNPIPVVKALSAAARVFPALPTLAELDRKGREAMHEGLTDPDVPAIQKALLGEKVVRLAKEVGEGESDGVTDATHHNLRRHIRLAARRFARAALRRAVEVGAEAVLAELLEFEEHERERFPKLGEIDAPTPRYS